MARHKNRLLPIATIQNGLGIKTTGKLARKAMRKALTIAAKQRRAQTGNPNDTNINQ